MFGKKYIFCFVCLILVGISGPAFADGENDEKQQSEGAKLHEFVQRAFVYPAGEAQRKREFQRAIDLYQRAIDEWSSKNYTDSWAIGTQRSQLYSCLRGQGDSYKSLGRYEDAVRLYLLAADLWSKSGTQNFMTQLEAARICLQGKMYAKGAAVLDNSLKNGNQYERLQAHFILAELYEQQGQLEQSERELTSLFDDKEFESPPVIKRSIRVQLQNFYNRQHRVVDAAKIQEQLNSKICPVCKSDKAVIPIGYGLPGGEMYEQSARGELQLGGCVSGPDSARWWCKTDKVGF